MKSQLHRSVKKRSLRSENRLASLLGGKRQPASGALPVAAFKGDVKTKFCLIDDKVTGKDSYSVKIDFMRKLRSEAFKAGNRKPVLSISFENRATYYVITEEMFLEYMRLKQEAQ
jgi:hypothetical protein